MDKNKKLHGNNARIDPKKDIASRFDNYVLNDYSSVNGVLMNKLADDAEFCKREVDMNRK